MVRLQILTEIKYGSSFGIHLIGTGMVITTYNNEIEMVKQLKLHSGLLMETQIIFAFYFLEVQCAFVRVQNYYLIPCNILSEDPLVFHVWEHASQTVPLDCKHT